ncbi:MAG: tyrosine-type recombinase/integrase, partial [Synergistaceae bacterium]|nr:tyrosine-type recombinase/integrase [Synergistaceae bacterium]
MKIVQPIRELRQIESMKCILKKNPRDLLLFVMGINTALRISDLLTLTVGDIRDERGKLRAFVTLREGKTGKLKRFPLNNAILVILKAYLKLDRDMGDSSFLFASNKGGGMPITRTHAWRILSAAARQAGLNEIGTHTLRKTFGYHAYRRTK